MAEKQRKITADDDGEAFLVAGDAGTGAIRAGSDFWKDIRYYPDKDRPDYVCCNLKHNADISKKNWRIWKITWSSGKITREQGPLMGSCDDRENLKWDK